jgi:1-acyl-sn-glycerol-3-phosphate acyltransferase
MYFRPPRERPLVRSLVKAIAPLWLRRGPARLKVELSTEARSRLESMTGPALLAPNHPTRDDPLVMYEVSRQVGAAYNYVAAYEVFEEVPGWQAWLMQAIGCYSVVRGTVDRESFRMTRKLLAEERRQIVIFIEGTAPYQNDSLLPFQPGVVQLGFWGLDDAVGAERAPQALPVVPICIKYLCVGDPLPEIEALLGELERKVLGESGTLAGGGDGASLLTRVRTLGEGVLTALERAQGIKADTGAALGERFEALRAILLERAEGLARVRPRTGAAITDRIFALRRAADAGLLGSIRGETVYQQVLFDEERRRLETLLRDVDRLTLFSNFHDAYLAEWPSPERIVDVLDRLYREVHGGRRPRLPLRRALVDVAEPVDLVGELDGYRADKKGTVAMLTATLQERTQALLEELYRTQTRPIVEPAAEPQP